MRRGTGTLAGGCWFLAVWKAKSRKEAPAGVPVARRGGCLIGIGFCSFRVWFGWLIRTIPDM